MDHHTRKFSTVFIVVIGIVVILAGLLLVFYNSKKDSPPPITTSGTSAVATAVPSPNKSTFTPEQRAEIQQIFLDSVRQKPNQFINAVNEGIKLQQDKTRLNIEKEATIKSKELLDSGLPLGNLQAEIKLIAFIDPLCPHCQNFIKLAFSVLKSRKDVLFYLIPIAILGEKSILVSKSILAAAKQDHKKFTTFIQKLNDKYAKLDKTKFPALVKEAGLDAKKFEKELNSKEVHKQLTDNTTLAETLKIPGVPTIFGIQNNGELVIVPPTDIKEFNQLIDNLKAPKPLTQEDNPVKADADET
jgi:protein-disulfide isomerase